MQLVVQTDIHINWCMRVTSKYPTLPFV